MIRGVFSGKGGVGKTTFTVNLGVALKRLENELVVVDGDLKNPNLIIHLGCLDHGKTLQEVLESDAPLIQAIIPHETGLNFVPTNLSLSFRDIDPIKLKKTLKECPYDILLDTPPGLNQDSLNALDYCDEIFVVAQPLLPDITDCMKTIEVARGLDKKVAGIILNKRRNKSYELTKEEIEAVTNTKVIAQIPWDEEFYHALRLKKPLVHHNPKNKASIEYFRAASLISGKPYIEPKQPFFGRFIYWLKSRPSSP
jgi:septum site-determining protein MinD